MRGTERRIRNPAPAVGRLRGCDQSVRRTFIAERFCMAERQDDSRDP